MWLEFGRATSDGATGVDELNVIGERGFQGWSEKGVMGASQNKDVCAGCHHVVSIFDDSSFDQFSFEGASFDQFDKLRAGLGDDAEVAGVCGDEVEEFVSFEREFGGENADGVGLGKSGCGFDAGLHADEGDGELSAQGFDRGDGGRVAGDDDEFGSLLDEELGEGRGPVADFFRRANSIGAPDGVGDVLNGSVGKEGVNFPKDREASDTGIDHSNHKVTLETLGMRAIKKPD